MLTEEEFSISKDDDCKGPINSCKTFTGNNTSGKIGSTDLGCGLYMKDSTRWVLVGITSIIPFRLSDECEATFTNVILFIDWIEKLND